MVLDLDSCLGIQREIPPDGNPCNPERIQSSDRGRSTEMAAEDLIENGLPLPTPTAQPTQNGQPVDTAKMLLCGNLKCGQYKPDAEFRIDARNGRSRRGRSHWCRACRSRYERARQFDALNEEVATRVLTGTSKRRKKK